MTTARGAYMEASQLPFALLVAPLLISSQASLLLLLSPLLKSLQLGLSLVLHHDQALSRTKDGLLMQVGLSLVLCRDPSL